MLRAVLHSLTLLLVGASDNASASNDVFFTISQADGNRMCLDLYGQSASNGNRVDAWECVGNPYAATIKGQQWFLDPQGLRSNVDPRKCVDAGDMSGKTLQIWDCNGLPQQKFSFDAMWHQVGDTGVGVIYLQRTAERMYLSMTSPSGGLSLTADIGGAQTWNVSPVYNENQLGAYLPVHQATGNLTVVHSYSSVLV